MTLTLTPLALARLTEAGDKRIRAIIEKCGDGALRKAYATHGLPSLPAAKA